MQSLILGDDSTRVSASHFIGNNSELEDGIYVVGEILKVKALVSEGKKLPVTIRHEKGGKKYRAEVAYHRLVVLPMSPVRKLFL